MSSYRTTLLRVVALLGLLLLGAAPAAARERAPDLINLPVGWQPEGIATGHGRVIYSGSLATGAIYAADLRTGEGRVVVPPQGHPAVGMKYDERSDYLFVAGGPTGRGFVYDPKTGAEVASYQLAAGAPTFINDVIITRDAAYFTDSFNPVVYRVAIGHDRKVAGATVTAITLGGDYQFIPGAFNANGIEATPNGKQLIIVNSTVGALYLVDARSGVAKTIDLGGGSVANGDGILLRGRTLYVVQNGNNQVAVVKLRESFTRGTIARLITNPNLDIPTTAAASGDSVYVVNARFGNPDPANATYAIVRVVGGGDR